MSEPQIELVGVTRTFQVRRREGLRRRTRTVTALHDVSYSVEAGEAVGCTGTPGAGKTTTVRIVAGMLTPSAGYVRTHGLLPVRQRAELVRRVGVLLAGEPALWPDLPLAESLRVLAAVHRLHPARRRLREDELVAHLDLGDLLATPVGQLPPGARRRAELAAAVLHEPPVLVLDEPTAGVDAVSRDRVRSFLRHENRVHGRTLLMTTRDLGELDRLCDRVLVHDHGRLTYDGSVPGLVEAAGGRRELLVTLVGPGPELTGIEGTELLSVEAGGLRQRLALTPGAADAAGVLAEVTARADVRDARLLEPDAEELARRLAPGI